jgi:hypothetical protein
MKKFDPKVFRLGYVALATADIERTREHYLESIGMTQRDVEFQAGEIIEQVPPCGEICETLAGFFRPLDSKERRQR